MTNRLSLAPAIKTLAATRSARWLSGLGAEDVLGWAGLSRARNRGVSRSALVLAGFFVGAAAAVLFTPASGKELRQRGGKRVGGTVGKQVGQLVGAHPVATAEVAREAREIFSPARASLEPKQHSS